MCFIQNVLPLDFTSWRASYTEDSVEASALSQFRTLALKIETKHLDYIRQRGSVL